MILLLNVNPTPTDRRLSCHNSKQYQAPIVSCKNINEFVSKVQLWNVWVCLRAQTSTKRRGKHMTHQYQDFKRLRHFITHTLLEDIFAQADSSWNTRHGCSSVPSSIPSSVSGSRILLGDAVHISSIQQNFPREHIDHLSFRTISFLQNSDCLCISVSRVPTKSRYNSSTIGYVVVDVRCRQPLSWDSGAETLLNMVRLYMAHTGSVTQYFDCCIHGDSVLLQSQLHTAIQDSWPCNRCMLANIVQMYLLYLAYCIHA